MKHARLRFLLIALGFCFLSIGWSNSASQTVETLKIQSASNFTELVVLNQKGIPRGD